MGCSSFVERSPKTPKTSPLPCLIPTNVWYCISLYGTLVFIVVCSRKSRQQIRRELSFSQNIESSYRRIQGTDLALLTRRLPDNVSVETCGVVFFLCLVGLFACLFWLACLFVCSFVRLFVYFCLFVRFRVMMQYVTCSSLGRDGYITVEYVAFRM